MHYAGQQPKMHIPLGIGVFLVLSALSPIPAVPMIGAGLVFADAVRRLGKSRSIVMKSYVDPMILTSRLTQSQLETTTAFAQMFTGDSSPKELPLPMSPVGESQIIDVAPVVMPEPVVSQAMPAGQGWQPQDLPAPLPEFLSRQIHILISATTGSGKTHMLQSLGAILANRNDTLLICDPKGSRWGQLEPAVKRMASGIDYFAVSSDLQKELERRINLNRTNQPVGPHLWVIFDEWTLLKGYCSSLDAAAKQLFQQRILQLIVAGRELNMHLIMVNQSHQLGDLSLTPGVFSSPMRDNLCTLGLGCKTTKDNAGNVMDGNDKSINSILQDNYLVKLSSDRAAAQAYHSELRSKPEVNRTYCVYANSLRIGIVPHIDILPVTKVNTFYSQDGNLSSHV